MTSAYYRKPHRYKKRKPIFRKKFLALVFLALVVAGAVFFGLFLWNIFWVDKIIVSGEDKVAKEEIEFWAEKRLENKILFFTTKSIWAVDTSQIKKDILGAFPQIAAVEVKKSFFDAINVLVIERQSIAVWCQAENCFLLDSEGIIFALSAEALAEAEGIPPETNLIKIIDKQGKEPPFLGDKVIEKEKLAQILEIKSRLAEVAKISIDKAAVLSEERLNVMTSEGWEIYFNLKGDLSWQVTELAVALEKQISPEKRRGLEYVDLRFSRVYYK